jgi:hypothetical protein
MRISCFFFSIFSGSFQEAGINMRKCSTWCSFIEENFFLDIRLIFKTIDAIERRENLYLAQESDVFFFFFFFLRGNGEILHRTRETEINRILFMNRNHRYGYIVVRSFRRTARTQDANLFANFVISVRTWADTKIRTSSGIEDAKQVLEISRVSSRLVCLASGKQFDRRKYHAPIVRQRRKDARESASWISTRVSQVW